MRRFIAAVARGASLSPADRAIVDRVEAELGANREVDLPQLIVTAVALPTTILSAEHGNGAILGNVFRKDRSGRVEALTGGEAGSILATHGAQLVDRYWGDYVAFLSRGARVDIVRAPFGELGLCWFEAKDTIFVASDLKLLASCGCDVRSIAWDAVARHLAEADIRRDETCLKAVRELRGGNRLTVASGSASIHPIWTPWVRTEKQGGDGTRAPRQLRATIDRCVADKVSDFERPLLLLSGGLDSSILASALTTAGKSTAALNLVTEDRSGDERDYARIVAATFGISYFEETRQIGNVDPLRSDAIWLPRPSVRSFLQDSRLLTDHVAATTKADVIIEGSGGDNVFCSLQSVTPVADRMRSGGSVSEVFGSARDIAQLTDATVLTVLRRAAYRAWFRSERYRMVLDHSLLSATGIALSAGSTNHPWLAAPKRAQPGKIGHAAMLVAAQGWVECLDPLAARQTLGPLLAQPVVEACFAIPTWQWFSAGQNRMVAREAYRGTLPNEILNRRSKATPDSFVTQLYNRDRPLFLELLLDGQLMREGLIDRSSLERSLGYDGPPLDHLHRRIMRIADVEVWLRARVGTSVSSPAGPGIP